MDPDNESRRDFINKVVPSSVLLSLTGPLAAEGETTTNVGAATAQEPDAKWRNRQPDMTYRMLGRTGMMISELGIGTFPFQTEECYPVLDAAVEKGINYFDCGAAYGSGKVEENIGKFFHQSKKRDRVFLTTKLSGYNKLGYAKRIYDGLSSAKQAEMKKRSEALIAERRVLAEGYHYTYFQGQTGQLERAYLYDAVYREYGVTKEWKKNIRKRLYALLEASMKRMKVDHIDVLFCPHGATAPDLNDDVAKEVLAEFKQKGMISASALSFHNDVAGNLAEAIRVGFYDVAMTAYNIANHAALEQLMYKAKQAGIGLVGMKAAKLFAREGTPQWISDKFDATMPDLSRSQFSRAYEWALGNPNLSGCLAECLTVEHLEDNIQATGRNPKYRSA